MRQIRGRLGGSLNPERVKRVAFQTAVRAIVVRVRAKTVNLRGTSMPAFKANTAAVFNRVSSGSIEVVTRGRQRFVVLALDQVIAIVHDTGRGRPVAELLAELPTVPASFPRLRATSVAAPNPYRIRDEPHGN